VRRLALTIFLLFYTASVVGLTVERTEQWASQSAGDHQHSRPHSHAAGFGEAHKRSPHQVNTKLHEDSSDLIHIARTVGPYLSETELHQRPIEFVSDANSRTVSSRAPPKFL
jgi:hypothetical protein